MSTDLRIQQCPACGWQNATVEYTRQEDGGGEAVAEAITAITCPNPYCEHGRPSPE